MSHVISFLKEAKYLFLFCLIITKIRERERERERMVPFFLIGLVVTCGEKKGLKKE